MEVFLRTYTCTENVVPYIHTEVNIMDVDISFGPGGISIEPETNKGLLPNCEEDRFIYCGTTNMGREEINRAIQKISRKYREYNLLTRNCRHFSSDFIDAMKTSQSADALAYLDELNFKCDVSTYIMKKVCDTFIKFGITLGFAGLTMGRKKLEAWLTQLSVDQSQKSASTPTGKTHTIYTALFSNLVSDAMDLDYLAGGIFVEGE